MPTGSHPDPEPADALRAALAAAEQAAASAYRDTARLIRLLTVIGTPARPAELIDRTLTVLSEVFAADVVCAAEAVDGRLRATASCGLPDGDPAYTTGWPLGPTAREVLAAGAASAMREVPAADLPPVLRDQGPASGAWIPFSGGSELVGDLLVLFRRGGDPFTPADLQVLLSVAYRMDSAVEARERGAAIERLATAGPGLARHLDPALLLAEAAALLRELIGTDHVWIRTVDAGVATLAAESHAGSVADRPRRIPVDKLPGWDRLRAGEPFVGLGEAGQTVMLVPVTRDGEVIAVLTARGRRARSFGKTAAEVATVLANYLSVAITNGELYRALKARERELHRRVSRDPLTGLANRTVAAQRIEEALATSRTGAVGLMFFDMDKFKAVNDRLGHEAGDELIQQVAARLRETVRQGDLLARFGGDEFVLVVDDAAVLGDLTDMGRRIQLALADPFVLRGERVRVSASIGAVLGRRGTATASAMLRDADAAMYVAKARGPGRVEVFDDEASHRSVDRLDLRSELSQALDRGQLSVVYQPLIELKSNVVRAFEALVRWTHPERGVVPPEVFWPMAEETGAIVPIGAWLLGESCARLAAWQREFPALAVGVDVAPAQLEPGQVDLLEVIRAAGADPGQVWFEVTERMDATPGITGQVAALRAAGVHFMLADFGMSYSGLSYLRRFPVEGLKIDRTFVASMNDDEVHRGVVRAILAVAESLSVDVAADGIETQAQLDTLLDLGCQWGQGGLLGPPLTADEATRALRTRR